MLYFVWNLQYVCLLIKLMIEILEADKTVNMATFTGSHVEDSISPQTSARGQEDGLPPQLQQLVQKALDEIKQEAKKGC
jgi:hypothetical protein